MLPPCCVRATQTIISCSMSLRRSMTFQSSTIKSWTLAGLITWPHHLSASAGVWRSLFVCGSLFVAASSDGQLQEHKEGRPTHEHTHTHTHPLSLSHTHTHTHTHSHTRFGLNCLEQHHQLDGIMAGQRSFPRCCCALQRRQGQNGRCCCCVFQLQANL